MRIKINHIADADPDWQYSCRCRAGLDDRGLPLEFMKEGERWGDQQGIDVLVYYDNFYFRSKEDLMSFVLRWAE